MTTEANWWEYKHINWIRCSDRMPKSGDRVLVYGDCGPKICVVEDHYGEIRFHGTSFDVTYWCPLEIPLGALLGE